MVGSGGRIRVWLAAVLVVTALGWISGCANIFGGDEENGDDGGGSLTVEVLGVEDPGGLTVEVIVVEGEVTSAYPSQTPVAGARAALSPGDMTVQARVGESIWTGKENQTYSVFIYVEPDSGSGPEPGDYTYHEFPVVYTQEGDKTITTTAEDDYILFEEIAEQQDSSVTLSVAGPGDRNGKNLCAEIDYHVYASETDREPIASACAEISGGTATVTLENDDGSTWYGTDTFFYDLEVYVDMDASGELSWNDYKSYDPFTAKRPSRFDGVSLNINGGFVLNTPPEDQRGEVTVEVVVESLPDPGDLIVEVYENGRFVDGDAPLARFERSIGSTGTVTASLARYLSSAPDLVYSSDEWYGVLGTQYDLVVFVDTNDDNVFDAGSDWRYRELPVNFNQNGDFDLAAYNDTNYGDGTVTYNASGSESDFTQASWN